MPSENPGAIVFAQKSPYLQGCVINRLQDCLAILTLDL